jgi:hypothetical protein
MKACYAAALGLVGWYLMFPPGEPGKVPFAPDLNAPLSEWSIQSSFDTAKECAAAKDELESRVLARVGKQHSTMKAVEMDSAICAATDDPRLKGN